MRKGETTTGPTEGHSPGEATDPQQRYSTFDPAAGEIAVDIAHAVANASGRDPARMEPLATVIDTDALNALSGNDRSPDAGWTELTFEYLEFDVTVCSDGVLTLDRRGD